MILQIENLTAGYIKNTAILKNVSLEIDEGEVVAVVGQNGAGKSTLAKSILNLVDYVDGYIYINKRKIKHLNKSEIVNLGVGYLMQGGPVFPNLTVTENLSFSGINISKKEFNIRKQKLEEYIPFLKNNNRFSINASYLSGGEKSQLALAMVLMRTPKFLILDEPSAGLSPVNIKTIYNILKKIKKEENQSILLIEQNVKFAAEFSDRLKLLKNGELLKEDMSFKKIEEEYFE